MKLKRFLPTGIVAGGALLLATTFTLQSQNNKPFPVPAYQVARVIDGDTFETSEKQLIRLASVEAPEKGLCGSESATKALEKLVLNKPVYLKIIYRDPYNRLVSYVYNDKEYINGKMIQDGYADYYNRDKEGAAELKRFSQEARSEKRGIHGSPCTQTQNTIKPSCTVKANVNAEKIYYTSVCFQYKNTVVELHKGDQWFCTEREAIKAGFRKAKQC